MPEEIDDPRLSAEGELALARLALDAGDYPHAADHVAAAIAHAPTMPEVHEVLAQLAARTSGGLDFFPLDEHVYIGVVVARAHLLAAAGRPGEGLELLAAATGHAPTADWAGVPWVGEPELPGRVGPEQLAVVLMQICAGIPDPVPEPERAPLLPYLALARHGVAAHPRHGLLLGAASALARRLGQPDLAVAWAARGAREEPSKLTEVWLGYAYRSAGRVSDAVTALRRAIDHDPEDLSVYADIAGTLADHGRLDDALEWIDRALAKDPSFDCAVHTAHRLHYRRDGELRHLVALADFQRDHPDASHEHNDLAECCHGLAWLGLLPPAGESVVHLVRGAAADRPAPRDVWVSALEPPSAMRLVTAAFPNTPITVESVPEPDPRTPRRPGGQPLWRYDGTVAEPAVGEPSPAAAEKVRRLAHPVWPHPPAAYDAAVALATLELDDLLGLLVHPPAPPANELGRALTEHDPALWVRCVQVWACLGLLHHRTDEPWIGSTRRRVLLDVVWGVEDWTTEAAVFALMTAGWVDPAVRADVAEIIGERLADAVRVGRERPISIAWSLGHLALGTPALSAEAAAAAHRLIATHDPFPPRRARRPGPFRRWLARRANRNSLRR
ncbi:Tetratricopeptide repeat-containing protein [Micromonospora pattaloongensis]|uniref:Tetratricopeptide repeat-containing protein n=1 Tax=Micromonospora pattaloongensis TaxID=405436 RepID=A0A1H3G0Q1_9ACTN|nr:tetratricopeptide repeat protein [Micromonospora pattaloongensis]SDX96816.1 Tetratricopeptide repeat-containing protein [Micromonospora pattaloongensis]